MKMTCNHCLGMGKEADESPCLVCLGTGEIEACFYSGTLAKLDAIIAEQAAQRADLTAALTTIINKLNE